MKILSNKKNTCAFEFESGELQLLFHILQRYPCTPQSYAKLSKFSDEQELKENEELLKEALAEQNEANMKLIKGFIADETKFPKSDKNLRICFSEEEIDWLLQILNDVRIGMWLKLGSPNQETPPQNNDPNYIREFSLMQISGEFEAFLLHALNSRAD